MLVEFFRDDKICDIRFSAVQVSLRAGGIRVQEPILLKNGSRVEVYANDHDKYSKDKDNSTYLMYFFHIITFKKQGTDEERLYPKL